MGHGFGAVRALRLYAYAERFAAAGYAVAVFDYRGLGDSAGTPRQLLDVAMQHQDWRAALAYARTLPGIDPDRIALWGSSFSGGHVAVTAAADPRVAAFSAQGPMMDGLAAVRALLGYAGVGAVARLTGYGLRDQARGWLGRSPLTIPLTAPPGELAAMTSKDAHEGYGAIVPPGWRNEMSARTVVTLAAYRPLLRAGRIRCPGLIQVCLRDSVAPAPAAIRLARRMGDLATLKEYDIGHFDIYVGADFERAVADQVDFFGRVLAPGDR